MSAFHNSLAEYLTLSLGEEDENDISPPKNAKLSSQWQKYDHEMNFLKEDNDDETALHYHNLDQHGTIKARQKGSKRAAHQKKTFQTEF